MLVKFDALDENIFIDVSPYTNHGDTTQRLEQSRLSAKLTPPHRHGSRLYRTCPLTSRRVVIDVDQQHRVAWNHKRIQLQFHELNSHASHTRENDWGDGPQRMLRRPRSDDRGSMEEKLTLTQLVLPPHKPSRKANRRGPGPRSNRMTVSHDETDAAATLSGLLSTFRPSGPRPWRRQSSNFLHRVLYQ